MARVFLALILLVSLAGLEASASEQDAFSAEIKSLYDFVPHTLDKEQMAAKSAQLDAFWSKVQSDPMRYLPWLRDELERTENPSFFHYDGSKLLLSLSDAEDDRRLALEAIPRVDLASVQNTDYLRTVHHLAVEGYDTSEAALRILAYPDFRAFIPQHALTLGQDYALVYMLLPASEEHYLEKVFSRLRTETDPTALKSILKLLWYVDTEGADAQIQWVSSAGDKPEVIRVHAGKMLDAQSEMRNSIGLSTGAQLLLATGLSPMSGYDQLRQKRKERLNRISDEALIELDLITNLMKTKR